MYCTECPGRKGMGNMLAAITKEKILLFKDILTPTVTIYFSTPFWLFIFTWSKAILYKCPGLLTPEEQEHTKEKDKRLNRTIL